MNANAKDFFEQWNQMGKMAMAPAMKWGNMCQNMAEKNVRNMQEMAQTGMKSMQECAQMKKWEDICNNQLHMWSKMGQQCQAMWMQNTQCSMETLKETLQWFEKNLPAAACQPAACENADSNKKK